MFESLRRTLYVTALLPATFLAPESVEADSLAVAENHSVPTLCAEHDNVNVPLLAPGPDASITSFTIEARHPSYEFGEDHGDEDFTDCPPPTHKDTFFEDPGTYPLYDDGVTAIVAVRIDRWWRPRGMTAIGPHGAVDDAHYVAVHRKLDAHHYPQVLVFYSDGNLRLKPFPTVDRADTLFGSSVVVGPAPVSDRPFVDALSIEYLPQSDSLEIVYDSGETAIVHFEAVTREATRLRVETAFRTGPDVAFATVRSMYVREGNNDVDHVLWRHAGGQSHAAGILAFSTASATEFFFQRTRASQHNTSAPDIWIGDFEVVRHPTEFRRGDANGDGQVDVTDPLLALAFQFLASFSPACLDALDFDDSGTIDVTDAVNNLDHQFLGGPPPRAPGKHRCGVDRTEDALDCEEFEICR